MGMIARDSEGRLADGWLLVGFLLMPLIGFFAPRFLAFWPAILGVISFVAVAVKYGGLPRLDWKIVGLAFAPVLLGAVSLLWAQDYDASLERVSKIAPLMFGGVLLLSMLKYFKIPKMDYVLAFMTLAVIVFAGVIAVELMSGMHIYRLTHGIDAETHVNPSNYNRAAIAVMIPGMIFMFIHLVRGNIRWALILLSFIGTMTFVSESQSLQLAFIVGAASFLFFTHEWRGGWVAAFVFIAGLVVAAPFIAQWGFGYAQTLSEVPFLTEGAAGPRLEIWDYVSRYAMGQPVTGFGIEVTRTITDFDSAEIYQPGTSILHPHNFAVQLWIEFGVIGVSWFVLWLALAFSIWGKMGPNAQYGYLLFPVFVMMLSIVATGYGMWQSWWLGLIFMNSALVMYINRGRE